MRRRVAQLEEKKPFKYVRIADTAGIFGVSQTALRKWLRQERTP
jgi:transposase-like protein